MRFKGTEPNSNSFSTTKPVKKTPRETPQKKTNVHHEKAIIDTAYMLKQTSGNIARKHMAGISTLPWPGFNFKIGQIWPGS